jgi:hypothetical protein
MNRAGETLPPARRPVGHPLLHQLGVVPGIPHGDEAETGQRLRAWWGYASYDREDWWEFEKFRDPER